MARSSSRQQQQELTHFQPNEIANLFYEFLHFHFLSIRDFCLGDWNFLFPSQTGHLWSLFWIITSESPVCSPFWTDFVIEMIISDFQSLQLCVNKFEIKFWSTQTHFLRQVPNLIWMNIFFWQNLIKKFPMNGLYREGSVCVRVCGSWELNPFKY